MYIYIYTYTHTHPFIISRISIIIFHKSIYYRFNVFHTASIHSNIPLSFPATKAYQGLYVLARKTLSIHGDLQLGKRHMDVGNGNGWLR